MVASKITHDYYAVLGITQIGDEDLIRASYKRLAKLRHPDKNLGNPQATAEFQLLNAAYSTLIDTAKRRDYDTYHYPSVRSKPPPKPTPTTTSTTTPSASSTTHQYTLRLAVLDTALQTLQIRQTTLASNLTAAQTTLNKTLASLANLDAQAAADQAEAAAALRAATTGAPWYLLRSFFGAAPPPVPLTAEQTAQAEARERRAAERQTGRLVVEARRARQEAEVAGLRARVEEVEREMMETRGRRVDVVRMWQRAERAEREEKERREREEWARARREEREKREREEREKREREERKRLRRMQEEWERRAREEREERAERAEQERQWKMWEQEQEQKARENQELRDRLQKEREQKAKEQQGIERERERQRARDLKMERQRMEKKKREKAREEQERERQRKAAEQMEETLERVRRAQEELDEREKQRREPQQRAAQAWSAVNAGKKRKPGPSGPSNAGAGRSCQHRAWWDRQEGRHLCSRCQQTTSRFAFQCPGCQMIACAPCREHLKGKV